MAASERSVPSPRRGARGEYVEVGLARPTSSWKYRGPFEEVARPCASPTFLMLLIASAAHARPARAGPHRLGPAARQCRAGLGRPPRSRRRRPAEAGGLRGRRGPRRLRQGQVLLHPQEPGGGAEALRRREVGRDPGGAARRRSPPPSSARASTSARAGCRSSTRPARRSSKRKRAAGPSCRRS